MRTEYLVMDEFLRNSARHSSDYLENLYWLAQNLGQPNRTRNRYLAFSLDYLETLRHPWRELPDRLANMRERYYGIDWDFLVNPFGDLFVLSQVRWQLKTTEMLRQVYVLDGKMRLATSVVRMIHDGIRDDEIPVFLENVGPELSDPFTGKPMKWDSANGRAYFQSGDDKCWITYLRVPVWDPKSERKPPKLSTPTIC
jgi:hypothetical protein